MLTFFKKLMAIALLTWKYRVRQRVSSPSQSGQDQSPSQQD